MNFETKNSFPTVWEIFPPIKKTAFVVPFAQDPERQEIASIAANTVRESFIDEVEKAGIPVWEIPYVFTEAGFRTFLPGFLLYRGSLRWEVADAIRSCCEHLKLMEGDRLNEPQKDFLNGFFSSIPK